MATVGDDLELGFDAGFLEGGIEDLALLQGDDGVLVAVKDEEWSGVF